jgi:hypothetical protein
LVVIAAAEVQARDASRQGRETAGSEPYTPALSESDVVEKLIGEGYTNITNLRHEGDLYTADAMRNGEPAHPLVDARNGRIVFE